MINFSKFKKIFLFVKLKIFFPVTIASLLLSGCWNYRDLNKITVVAGTAVDKGQEKEYSLSVEVIVMESAGKDGKIKSSLVEGKGDNIKEALEDINRKLSSKLYYGNMQTLVISKELAEEEQIREILEGFFRDPDRRETVDVFISQEETAKKIITPDPKKSEIASYALKENNDKNSRESSNTFKKQTFEAYNELKRETGDLTLPVYHIVKQFESEDKSKPDAKSEEMGGNDSSNKEEGSDSSKKKEEVKTIESNGAAIFSGNKMVGLASNEEMPYFLFSTNQIYSGGFSFKNYNMENPDITTLSLIKNKTKLSYGYEGEKLFLEVKISADMGVSELSKYVDFLNLDETEKFTRGAEEFLNEKIAQFIHKTQELKGDVCGFGTKIYKSDKKLWENIKKDWREIYKNAEIKVSSKIRIVNTGFIIKY